MPKLNHDNLPNNEEFRKSYSQRGRGISYGLNRPPLLDYFAEVGLFLSSRASIVIRSTEIICDEWFSRVSSFLVPSIEVSQLLPFVSLTEAAIEVFSKSHCFSYYFARLTNLCGSHQLRPIHFCKQATFV